MPLHEDGLTPNECQAIRYLNTDGYSWERLAQLFGLSHDALELHLNDRCDCPDIDEPVEWDPEGFTGEDLLAKRMDRDMGQRDVAEEIGVCTATVSCWEREERVPRPPNVRKLMQLFGGDS